MRNKAKIDIKYYVYVNVIIPLFHLYKYKAKTTNHHSSKIYDAAFFQPFIFQSI